MAIACNLGEIVSSMLFALLSGGLQRLRLAMTRDSVIICVSGCCLKDLFVEFVFYSKVNG